MKLTHITEARYAGQEITIPVKVTKTDLVKFISGWVDISVAKKMINDPTMVKIIASALKHDFETQALENITDEIGPGDFFGDESGDYFENLAREYGEDI